MFAETSSALKRFAQRKAAVIPNCHHALGADKGRLEAHEYIRHRKDHLFWKTCSPSSQIAYPFCFIKSSAAPFKVRFVGVFWGPSHWSLGTCRLD